MTRLLGLRDASPAIAFMQEEHDTEGPDAVLLWKLGLTSSIHNTTICVYVYWYMTRYLVPLCNTQTPQAVMPLYYEGVRFLGAPAMKNFATDTRATKKSKTD